MFLFIDDDYYFFKASTNERDLNNVQTILRANHGDKGRNKDCHGANADHLVVKASVFLNS